MHVITTDGKKKGNLEECWEGYMEDLEGRKGRKGREKYCDQITVAKKNE